MSFLLECPNCGKRPASEFTFRGEYRPRPAAQADFSEWVNYLFLRDNRKGEQKEWWYHRAGCQRWFLVVRDTMNNSQHESFWFSRD